MTNATINNQSQRTSAILKTAGLYLLTLVILILLARSCGGDSTVCQDMEEKVELLEQNNSDLNAMILKMDTISSMAQELVELNKKNRESPGSKQGDIDNLEARIQDFYGQLYQLGKRPELVPQYSAMQNIYSSTRFMQGRINEHLNHIDSQNKQYSDDLDDQNLSEQEIITKLNQDAIALNTSHASDLQDLNGQIQSKDLKIQTLETDIAALKEQMTTVKTDIQGMIAYLDTELGNSPIAKGWKPVVEQLNIKVTTLSAKLQ